MLECFKLKVLNTTWYTSTVFGCRQLNLENSIKLKVKGFLFH